MEVTLGDIVQSLQGQSGVLVIFLLIIWTGFDEKWVFGRELRAERSRNAAMEQELQELRQAGLRALLTAQEGRDLSYKLLQGLSSPTESRPS